MKLCFSMLVITVIAFSCTPASNYKAERDEVMKFHDTVMELHGTLVGNEMKIDTLLHDLAGLKKKFPQLDTLQEKKTLMATAERLKKAEGLMNSWMHQFEPDIMGKSEEEAVTYFKKERVKIATIDSLYKVEIKSSAAYLTKLGK